MENRKRFPFELTAFHLRVMALCFMLLDHLWGTVVSGNLWMTCVGRLAFPIFAFQTVEGYHYTGDLRRYKRRLLLFAVLAEIPFNLILGGGPVYPFHQNVLWTLLLGQLMMERLDRVKGSDAASAWKAVKMGLWVLLFFLLGVVLMVDYSGQGILMIFVFYLFRGKKWSWWAQLAAMIYINCFMMKGRELALFDGAFFFPLQGFAVLAMLPIGLYRGKRGYHAKWWKWFSYAFYPLHALAIYLVWKLIL